MNVPPPLYPGFTTETVCRGGAVHKARIVFAVRDDGVACVIKDLAPMRPLLRWLYGRRNLEREARILERLDSFEGAPRLIERVSRDAIAIERVPTRYKYLRKKIPRERLPRVLRAFERTVVSLHELRVVHLDLRQRKNVLIPDDDRVVLIDFESARDLGRSWFGRRILFPLLSPIDRNAVLKWKVKFTPLEATAEERARVRRYGSWKILWPWKRLGRALRRALGSDVARHRPR